MKNLIILLMLLGLSGCATVSSTDTSPTENIANISQSRDIIGLEGLETPELAALDKKAYFVTEQARVYNLNFKKNGSIIFINSNLKQKNINLNTVNLRHWINKNLTDHQYYIDRLGPLVSVAILVEYGMSEVEDPTYKQFSEKQLYNRYLKIYAIDYIRFKNKKKIDLLWETTISSVGPSNDLASVLPVLAAFLPETIEKDFKTNKKMIIPLNDARLNSTREIPTSIPTEEFKPTIDELNFFN